jgi:hypothetical protein
MKKVLITDKRILDNLKKKGELAQKNLKIIQEMEKMEKEVNKNASKLKMLDEKVRPLILEEVSKIVLTEYEELVRVFNDEGKWTMEFADQLETFKANWNKRNEKK